MAKRKKNNYYMLSPPGLFQRVWKVWGYNIICSVVCFGLFFGFFTIDDVAFEIDYFLMWTFFDLRPEFIACVVLGWFAFRQFFKDINLIIFTKKTKEHDQQIIDEGGYKRMYEGTEGMGKTLNLANDLIFLAAEKDRKMHLQYYLKYPFRSELEKDPDFKVLTENFAFYQANKAYIPHLMANFKIGYKDRREYPFNKDYLEEKARMPEGMACGLTELGNLLPNSESRLSKDEKKDKFNMRTIAKILSLTRQYADWHILGDEQRSGEVALQFRSVVSRNAKLESTESVLEPAFLQIVLDIIEGRIMKAGENNKKWCSKLYWWLEELIQDIGFYEYKFRLSEAITSREDKDIYTFVISRDIPFDFDTRGERRNYRLFAEKPKAFIK